MHSTGSEPDPEPDIQGADMAFSVPVVKVSETRCRCRECNRDDVPMAEMAICSWKECRKMFTGICRKCLLEDHRQ